MTHDLETPDRVGGAERLDRLRDRLAASTSIPDGWTAELRAAFESSPPEWNEAVRRLLLMAEVWECLAADGAGAAAELPHFFSEALDRLAEGIRSDDHDQATAWILRKSGAGWGEYLALLDPSLDPGPGADPWGVVPADASEESTGSAIDLTVLLRAMTGSDPPAEPAEVRAAESAPEPDSSSPTASASDGEWHDHEAPHENDDTEGDRAGVDLEKEARLLELDPEIRGVFAADLSDLFGRIQDLVLSLGNDDDDARLLHELGRCYHTLKGAAGSVGLVGLASEIHALEDRLEQAGGRFSAELARRLEASLERLERVLGVLNGSAPAGHPSEAPRRAGRSPGDQDRGDRLREPQAQESDGLIRVSANRFEELTDLCSELLTRRKAWAEQAERMKQLADTTQVCSHRLRLSVDRLGETALRDTRHRDSGRHSRDEDLVGLVRRMTEQAEDLAALAATLRAATFPALEEAETLSRLSVRLWESLQSVRVVPVRGLFHRLVRVARDAARVEGRAIEVHALGEETGADRVLLDKAYEPLLHIVRNAVGHGVEPSEERVRAGKPAAGRITLEARREGNTLAITVQDDGRGLDYDAIAAKGRLLGLLGPEERPGIERLNALIFHPGFSTRGQANAISGRGVGMDVVARDVERLRGRVELTSQAGQGTRLTMRLPARLSLEHVMVVRVGRQAFAIPMAAIDCVHRVECGEADATADRPIVTIGDRRLPLADLGSILGIADRVRVPCPTVLVVGVDGEVMAIRVDGIDGALELVIRPLGPLLTGHPVISGVGLTTSGEIVPAIDLAGLLRLARRGSTRSTPSEVADRPRALVVDDSLSVRRVVTRNLRALGIEVDEVADGEQALGKLRHRAYRLIVTDLEMPRMDGFALLAELGRTGALRRIPVVVASTLSDPETRRRVLELGAWAYVTKPVVTEELADVVGAILAGEGAPPLARGGSPRC